MGPDRGEDVLALMSDEDSLERGSDAPVTPPDIDDEDFLREMYRHHPEDLREALIRQHRYWSRLEDAEARGRAADARRNSPLAPLAGGPCVRLTVRLPHRLHAEAVRVVADSGISLNTFLVTAVAKAIGQEYEPLE